MDIYKRPDPREEDFDTINELELFRFSSNYQTMAGGFDDFHNQVLVDGSVRVIDTEEISCNHHQSVLL